MSKSKKRRHHSHRRTGKMPSGIRDYSAESYLTYYLKRISNIKDKEPYLSIILVSCGIEYLGKCINNVTDWNESHSADDFKAVMNHYDAFKNYRGWLLSYDLYKNLRCGLVHSLTTEKRISLVNTGPNQDINGYLTISAQQYYNDFLSAVNTFRKEKKRGIKPTNTPFVTIKEELGLSYTSTTEDTRIALI